MSPIAELRSWIAESLARCRAMRWLGAAFRFDVAQDIVADVEAQQKQIVADAYAAEQSDIEAAQLIETAMADGIDATDRPAFQRAVRLIRSSANRDHQIAEVART